MHGTGLSHRVWDPVADLLFARRELLLADLPGHGASPPPAEDVEPTPVGYARSLAALLDELGLETVDVAGNSVGGWTALELAKMGRARSVVALAPAGLWANKDPLSAWGQLWAIYQGTRLFGPLVARALRTGVGRSLLLRGTVGDPGKVPPDDAVRLAMSYRQGSGVREHLLAMRRIPGFRGGRSIAVPVTVVWGDKERIVPKRARQSGELPPHTREIDLPGCGHVMTWDDPERVAETILEGSR